MMTNTIQAANSLVLEFGNEAFYNISVDSHKEVVAQGRYNPRIVRSLLEQGAEVDFLVGNLRFTYMSGSDIKIKVVFTD